MIIMGNNKDKLVIPGDLIATGKYIAGRGVFRVKSSGTDQFYAAMVGLPIIKGNSVSVVPLEGSYIPNEGDEVLGIISEVGVTSWRVDIRGPYLGIMNVNSVVDRHFDPFEDDLNRILTIGDLVKARIVAADRTRDPVLTMQDRGLRKLVRGRLIEADPVKVPRIIGRGGSMITLIKRETNSQLIVGKNGRILILAETPDIENIIVETIRKIESESHTKGLTDRIRENLIEKLNNQGN